MLMRKRKRMRERQGGFRTTTTTTTTATTMMDARKKKIINKITMLTPFFILIEIVKVGKKLRTICSRFFLFNFFFFWLFIHTFSYYDRNESYNEIDLPIKKFGSKQRREDTILNTNISIQDSKLLLIHFIYTRYDF